MSVYFISCRKTGMVKIGCAYDPFDRLKSLQTGSPTKLKIEALLKGSTKRERELHKLLKKHRVRGEWFRLCPEIEAIIKEANTPTRVKSLSSKGKSLDLETMNEETSAKPNFARPVRIPPGFTYETLPSPTVTPGFDERALSREQRKRIASGDITFPFRRLAELEGVL
jgi:hypothetical protein